MHLPGALHDRDLRPEREQSAFHEFWENGAEQLHHSALLPLLNGVEVNAESNLADKVQGEQYIQRREVDSLAARRCIIKVAGVLLYPCQ